MFVLLPRRVTCAAKGAPNGALPLLIQAAGLPDRPLWRKAMIPLFGNHTVRRKQPVSLNTMARAGRSLIQ